MPAKKTKAEEPAETPKADTTEAPTQAAPAEEPKAKKGPDFGPFVSKDENFTINYKDNGTVEISPRPWEGPVALVTRQERIAELVEALSKLK